MEIGKILIPSNADCFFTNYGVIAYHVAFDNDTDFERFCNNNNIDKRPDVVKSARHVFSNNINVFENYPDKVVQFI